MAEITIDIPVSTPYRVHVGTRLLEAAGSIARNAVPRAHKVAIVTDTNVGRSMRTSFGMASRKLDSMWRRTSWQPARSTRRLRRTARFSSSSLPRSSTARMPSLRSAAGSWAIWPASLRRRICAASPTSRCRRHCSPWSIPPWEASVPSTSHAARTSPARSGNPQPSSPTSAAWARSLPSGLPTVAARW